MNDVYDMLGIERSGYGAVVGWVIEKDGGDNFIDFGVFNGKSESARDFVNGRETPFCSTSMSMGSSTTRSKEYNGPRVKTKVYIVVGGTSVCLLLSEQRHHISLRKKFLETKFDQHPSDRDCCCTGSTTRS